MTELQPGAQGAVAQGTAAQGTSYQGAGQQGVPAASFSAAFGQSLRESAGSVEETAATGQESTQAAGQAAGLGKAGSVAGAGEDSGTERTGLDRAGGPEERLAGLRLAGESSSSSADSTTEAGATKSAAGLADAVERADASGRAAEASSSVGLGREAKAGTGLPGEQEASGVASGRVTSGRVETTASAGEGVGAGRAAGTTAGKTAGTSELVKVERSFGTGLRQASATKAAGLSGDLAGGVSAANDSGTIGARLPDGASKAGRDGATGKDATGGAAIGLAAPGAKAETELAHGTAVIAKPGSAKGLPVLESLKWVSTTKSHTGGTGGAATLSAHAELQGQSGLLQNASAITGVGTGQDGVRTGLEKATAVTGTETAIGVATRLATGSVGGQRPDEVSGAAGGGLERANRDLLNLVDQAVPGGQAGAGETEEGKTGAVKTDAGRTATGDEVAKVGSLGGAETRGGAAVQAGGAGGGGTGAASAGHGLAAHGQADVPFAGLGQTSGGNASAADLASEGASRTGSITLTGVQTGARSGTQVGTRTGTRFGAQGLGETGALGRVPAAVERGPASASGRLTQEGLRDQGAAQQAGATSARRSAPERQGAGQESARQDSVRQDLASQDAAGGETARREGTGAPASRAESGTVTGGSVDAAPGAVGTQAENQYGSAGSQSGDGAAGSAAASFASAFTGSGNRTPAAGSPAVHAVSAPAGTLAGSAVDGAHAGAGAQDLAGGTNGISSVLSEVRNGVGAGSGAGAGYGQGGAGRTDVAGINEPHRTLVATPTTLEVGVPDGTQGWLRIRAQVSDQGQVSASLAGGSSASQEMLHRELPALNAFLHNEQMPVTAAVAERSFAAGGGMGDDAGRAMSSHGGSAGAQTGSQTGGQTGGSEVSDSGARGSSTRVEVGDAMGGYRGGLDTVAGLNGAGPGGGSSDAESGRWLNVRA